MESAEISNGQYETEQNSLFDANESKIADRIIDQYVNQNDKRRASLLANTHRYLATTSRSIMCHMYVPPLEPSQLRSTSLRASFRLPSRGPVCDAEADAEAVGVESEMS
jgi:hypothetical protein